MHIVTQKGEILVSNKKKESAVIAKVRESLGRDFSKAIIWYKGIYGSVMLDGMTDERYLDMENKWKLMIAIGSMLEVDPQSGNTAVTIEQRFLDRTFVVLSRMFNGPDIPSSDDEKRSYIAECMELFNRQTMTETLHKESASVLKLSYEDISFGQLYSNGPNNCPFFDSRRASKFIGSNIQRNQGTTMRWVETSEDGISRLLASHGLSQVIIFMGTQGKTEEEQTILLSAKTQIFLHGVTDIATGKHYMCSAPSASSTRHADFPFVEASSPADVYRIWCEITGFDTIESLLGGIGSFKNGRYMVNLAKLKARIAMRGSNSFDTSKVVNNPEILRRLQNPRVDYVSDAKGAVQMPYKTITSPGILEMQNLDGTKTVERV